MTPAVTVFEGEIELQSEDGLNPMNPITEDDIANYLANSPKLSGTRSCSLPSFPTSPHGNRAVSLQERQAEMLREKIKALEHRIMDMVRHRNENMVIADRIHRWARSLLLVQSTRALPATLVAELQGQFMVPQVALKVWDVDARYGGEPFAQGVSEDAKTFASSLTQPYCGVATGVEAVGWLQDPATAMSIALIPLRPGAVNGSGPAFGMGAGLKRTAGLPVRPGTDFPEPRQLASAALAPRRGAADGRRGVVERYRARPRRETPGRAHGRTLCWTCATHGNAPRPACPWRAERANIRAGWRYRGGAALR
jgi:uncharacterized protein YigA (DUF484 family)